MRREILRVNNLCSSDDLARRVENISMCILEGECVGFAGLSYSGKDFLIDILRGKSDFSWSGSIYIDGQKVESKKQLQRWIYHMSEANYVIGDWSVAEYMGLLEAPWILMAFQTKKLQEAVRQYFNSLKINIDVTRKIGNLTELEKRVVDLAKARKLGAKVVIIEDEFDGMRMEDMEEMFRINKQLLSEGMAVIINSHSDTVMSVLSEKYIIFSKGHIAKKCFKDRFSDFMQIKHRFLGTSNQVGERKPDDAGPEQTPERNTVYEVQGLSTPKNNENCFKFFRGEVTTFLVMDRREKEHIFQVLAGRSSEDGIRYLVNDRIYKGGEAALLTEEKVVSIGALGSREEIFTEMTVAENMLLPSLKKISQMEYIRYSSHLMKVVTDEGDIDEPVQGKKAGELGINELLIMTLERWYLYRPQVLVLLEPFAMCDVDGVSVVKSYLLKFVESGTAVIIIKSRDEYIEDISNNIFCIE